MTEQQQNDRDQMQFLAGYHYAHEMDRLQPAVNAIFLGLAFLAGMLFTHFLGS